jgi:hypothetical protein
VTPRNDKEVEMQEATVVKRRKGMARGTKLPLRGSVVDRFRRDAEKDIPRWQIHKERLQGQLKVIQGHIEAVDRKLQDIRNVLEILGRQK